jgi:hypothetical protein
VGLLVWEPIPCFAQPDGDAAEQSAAARALFTQGVEHADRQQWNDAADRFRRAMAMRPSPVIAYNLAQTLVHINRLVEATEHLRFVLRSQDANRSVRAGARRMLDSLQPRLATLTIRVSGHVEGAEFRLDGEEVSSAVLAVPMPADPGRRRITAHRGGAEVASMEVALAEGASGEATLEVPAPPVVPTPVETANGNGEDPDRDPVLPDPDRIPDGRDRGEDEGGSVFGRWWFWTIVVVAVAGGVTAGILLSRPDAAEPVQGTFDPGVLEVR